MILLVRGRAPAMKGLTNSISKSVFFNPFPAMLATIVPFSILTAEDFTCQGRISRRERVNFSRPGIHLFRDLMHLLLNSG